MREGLLLRENGCYLLDRARLNEPCDFHRIRLDRMVRVLANELEAVRPAASILSRCVNLPGGRIGPRVSEALRAQERCRFSQEQQDSPSDDPQEARSGGEPFFLKARGSRRGVVLVHGYLSSPWQMEPMAGFLRRFGWNVYAVRLPGHGTSSHHLEDVRWEQWLRSVTRGCAVLRQHCDSISLVGFSLGGILALLAAARAENPIDAVVSINAPFKLRDRRAWLVHPILAWHRTLARLGVRRERRRIENQSESPDLNYSDHALESVRELRRAVQACRRELPDLRAPVLLMQATHDPVADPAGAHRALRRLGSQHAVLSEPVDDRHLIVCDAGSCSTFSEIVRFLDAHAAADSPRRGRLMRRRGPARARAS